MDEMYSDSSSFIDTTYSVDVCIENYLKRRRELRRKERLLEEDERRIIFEEFESSDLHNVLSGFRGLHFYTFNHKKIKFGFNPSEVAHVSTRVKFICILKYTRTYWGLGRNTVPVNLKGRLVDLFYKGESVDDENILNVINEIHILLMEWSGEHEEFRRRKIEKYRNGDIDYLHLDSEDEEIHLTQSERETVNRKRERILMRMASRQKKRKKKESTTKYDFSEFELCPSIELDSD